MQFTGENHSFTIEDSAILDSRITNSGIQVEAVYESNASLMRVFKQLDQEERMEHFLNNPIQLRLPLSSIEFEDKNVQMVANLYEYIFFPLKLTVTPKESYDIEDFDFEYFAFVGDIPHQGVAQMWIHLLEQDNSLEVKNTIKTIANSHPILAGMFENIRNRVFRNTNILGTVEARIMMELQGYSQAAIHNLFERLSNVALEQAYATTKLSRKNIAAVAQLTPPFHIGELVLELKKDQSIYAPDFLIIAMQSYFDYLNIVPIKLNEINQEAKKVIQIFKPELQNHINQFVQLFRLIQGLDLPQKQQEELATIEKGFLNLYAQYTRGDYQVYTAGEWKADGWAF